MAEVRLQRHPRVVPLPTPGGGVPLASPASGPTRFDPSQSARASSTLLQAHLAPGSLVIGAAAFENAVLVQLATFVFDTVAGILPK